jgi:hypothetical protein
MSVRVLVQQRRSLVVALCEELHLRLLQDSAASNAGEEGATYKQLKHLVLGRLKPESKHKHYRVENEGRIKQLMPNVSRKLNSLRFAYYYAQATSSIRLGSLTLSISISYTFHIHQTISKRRELPILSTLGCVCATRQTDTESSLTQEVSLPMSPTRATSASSLRRDLCD